MTKRKVVCVWGKFDDKSDFVLEPVCEPTEHSKEETCEICKDGFWIEDVKENKK